jgi:hypothetical protein
VPVQVRLQVKLSMQPVLIQDTHNHRHTHTGARECTLTTFSPVDEKFLRGAYSTLLSLWWLSSLCCTTLIHIRLCIQQGIGKEVVIPGKVMLLLQYRSSWHHSNSALRD